VLQLSIQTIELVLKLSSIALASKHTQHLSTFTREKALVACIVGVLKPGKSNTASIADDKWVSEKTLREIDDILSLFEFVKRLLEVSLKES